MKIPLLGLQVRNCNNSALAHYLAKGQVGQMTTTTTDLDNSIQFWMEEIHLVVSDTKSIEKRVHAYLAKIKLYFGRENKPNKIYYDIKILVSICKHNEEQWKNMFRYVKFRRQVVYPWCQTSHQLQGLELLCRISWLKYKFDIKGSNSNMFNAVFQKKVNG